jgi:hypothetical protein
MVSTNPKTTRNRSLTTRRHSVGGAPPPEEISALAQDYSEEYFSLRAIICPRQLGSVERLSLWIWTTPTKLKLKCHYLWPLEHYTLRQKGLHQHRDSRRNTNNWRLHQATWKEATTPSQRKRPEKPRLFKISFASWKPSNSYRILFVHTR